MISSSKLSLLPNWKCLTSVIYILISISSCTYSSSNKQEVIPTNVDTLVIEKNISVNEDSIIGTLKEQLNDYIAVFTSGDVEKTIHYLYPDMFVWMKKTAPQYGESFEIEDAKEWFAETVEEMKKMQSEQGFEFSWSLEPIEKIYESGNTLIYISVTSLIAKRGYDEFKMGDENICISLDGGENWKFLSNAEESAPDILRMKFSEDIVRKITIRYN